MEGYHNVINALMHNKKHWHKPPKDFGPDNREDSDDNRNGLKDVGDFSKINVSQQYSFVSETEGDGDCHTLSNKDSETHSYLHQSFCMEGSSEAGYHYSEISASLDIARKAKEQYGLHLLREQLLLENKYKKEIQRKTSERQEAYLLHLNQIHLQHEEEALKYQSIQSEYLKYEENHLRRQEKEALLEIQRCETEYTCQVSKYSSQLLDAVESARRQKAEQASLIQSLIAQMQTVNADFHNKMDIMYQMINELEGSGTLNKNMETHLNHTKSEVENILNISHQRLPTKLQLNQVQMALQQGLIIVESVIQRLDAAKVEKANQEEAKRIHEYEKETKDDVPPQIQRQESSIEQESIESEQKNEVESDTVPEVSNKERLLELQQKVNNFLQANEKLPKDTLWDMRRKATVANQLNKDSHSINRDKLQKLLNVMREKKSDVDVLASYKNSVISNIVKQVAIQDAVGASAYSWLLVELVTYHPDLWDLFLYYLFKACPMLMPGSHMSEEILENIEKPDFYYSQVGKYSTMYGFVLTRLSKKQGSPIRAAAIGWEVVANIVSQPPLSGITGELLLRFIQSFGYMLQQTYMKQFVKLMEFIWKCYLPRVREATEEGGQNCLTLLENFIADFRPYKLPQNSLILKFM